MKALYTYTCMYFRNAGNHAIVSSSLLAHRPVYYVALFIPSGVVARFTQCKCCPFGILTGVYSFFVVSEFPSDPPHCSSSRRSFAGWVI